MIALMLGACVPPPIERASDRGPQIPPPPIATQEATPADRAQSPDRLPPAAPPPRPAWEARPVTPDAREVRAQDYYVRPGDTLRGVANFTGAGSEAIARANGLTPPCVLRLDQKLVIPAGRYHLVRAGETGIAIARAYGVPWAQVVEPNALAEPYVLRAGQRILIPRGGPMTPAERARAFAVDIEDIVTGGEPALAANANPVAPAPTARRVLPPEASVAAPSRFVGGFGWPVEGRIVSRFGPGASGERQNGIKIAVPLRTPVLATADGVVSYTGSGVKGLGGIVIVRHGDGWSSIYGHVGEILVQRGQAVKRGQAVALSGDSGFADQPELHFELRKGRVPVDPVAELPGR